MSISCFVVREILNEFLETDEVFSLGLEILSEAAKLVQFLVAPLQLC